MKRLGRLNLVIGGVVLAILLLLGLYNLTSDNLLGSMDPAFSRLKEGKDIEVTLSYQKLESRLRTAEKRYLIEPNLFTYSLMTTREKQDLARRTEPLFTITIKNISGKSVSLRNRVWSCDWAGNLAGLRGESTFQLFFINSLGRMVSLHQYSGTSPLRPFTELNLEPFKPGEIETRQYIIKHGDEDFKRIGSHGVVAGVRYYDWDSKQPDDTTLVAWSNTVHIPDDK